MSAPNVENLKEKDRRKKKEVIKVTLRRLPPYITWEELKEQLDPMPPYEYAYFCPADLSFAPHAFSRCYFYFTNEQDVLDFSEKFNRYVFVDKKGFDSAAMVELAIYQKVPKKKREDMAKDTRCGIIEQEVEYLRFVDELETARHSAILTLEEQLRNVHLTESANKAGSVQQTPLTQYLVKFYEEKAQKKEERRKALDKFRKNRSEREHHKEKEKPTPKEKSRDTAGTSKDAEENTDKVMRKLGLGRNKEEKDIKKPPPRNPPREKPIRTEKTERPPRNPDEERKKKDRPEREIYRPGQRSRQKVVSAKPETSQPSS